MNKILIIEDDKVKIERFSSFFENDDFTIRESFHSGLKELIDFYDKYDLLILDMTIPLWEKGSSDFGGNYEQFGGERILREMKRRKKEMPTILVTMFDIFPSPEGNITFEQLNSHLKLSFPNFYLGAVFYNASEDNWKIDLEKLVKSLPSK